MCLPKAYSFDLNNNRLGITFVPLVSKCYLFDNSFHEDYNFEGQSGYMLGFKYLRIINDKIRIETGLHYSELYIYLGEDVKLDNFYQSRREQRNIISFPIAVERGFKYDFFITAGAQIDFELNTWTKLKMDDQKGIGLLFSIGKTFHISENVYFSVAPNIKMHSVIPFDRESNHQRLFDYGIKLDITYGFLR